MAAIHVNRTTVFGFLGRIKIGASARQPLVALPVQLVSICLITVLGGDVLLPITVNKNHFLAP